MALKEQQESFETPIFGCQGLPIAQLGMQEGAPLSLSISNAGALSQLH